MRKNQKIKDDYQLATDALNEMKSKLRTYLQPKLDKVLSPEYLETAIELRDLINQTRILRRTVPKI